MKLSWPEEALYFAVDKNGIGYFYKDKPKIQSDIWEGYVVYTDTIYVKEGTFNWKKTLIKNPKMDDMDFKTIKKQLEEL